MDFNQTLKILQEKELPKQGSLMRKIYNLFDRYGVSIQGSNKIVYKGRDASEFILIMKDYLAKKLNLKSYKGNEFEDPDSHERFYLNLGKNSVELIFN